MLPRVDTQKLKGKAIQSSTEMSPEEAEAFRVVRMVYQSVILENINKNVVHMVTYQRQRDIGGLRRVVGYEEGYHNTRSVYMDVPIVEFNVAKPCAAPICAFTLCKHTITS
jgi:hypothetical protein